MDKDYLCAMKHYTIPVFVPELACPNRCVFCNQNSISGCLEQPGMAEVAQIIEDRLKTIPKEGTHIEIGFFGGNFTGIEETLQRSYLSIAYKYLVSEAIQGIRLSTRPDYIDLSALGLLKEYGVSTIELGAQSLDDEVLKLAGRGHSVSDIEKASRLILENGFKLGLQMMTGLPGDTPDKSIRTAKKIIQLGAENTRIYPTLVIKDTQLAELWHNGSYKPQSLEEAVTLTATLLEIFKEAGVKVIRVGLHPSKELLEGGELLAGPYHPNFRQLAERVFEISHEASNSGPLIIADKRIPLPSKNALRNMGQVIFLEDQFSVYKSVSGHPDIFMCSSGNKVVVAPGLDVKIKAQLEHEGYEVTEGKNTPRRKYPETAIYNAVITSRSLIHNLRITDPVLLDTFSDREKIHVNQGYTRCNLLSLNDSTFITSDRGIEKVLISKGYEVLYVDPKPVMLKGQKNGFFPGCCGIWDNKVIINGSLKYHPAGAEVEEFISNHRTPILNKEMTIDNQSGMHLPDSGSVYNYKIISLYDGPLRDIGSIFFFEGSGLNKMQKEKNHLISTIFESTNTSF